MKMEQTECSETSAYKLQTPGNYPKENVYIQFDLLRMSIILLETCRGLQNYMNKEICVLIW